MKRQTPRPQESKIDHDVLRDLTAELMVACGARLQERREKLKIHRRELAQLAGTSEPTIIRIETGVLNPKDSLRMAIAGVLCCEVADIWSYPTCKQISTRAAA